MLDRTRLAFYCVNLSVFVFLSAAFTYLNLLPSETMNFFTRRVILKSGWPFEFLTRTLTVSDAKTASRWLDFSTIETIEWKPALFNFGFFAVVLVGAVLFTYIYWSSLSRFQFRSFQLFAAIGWTATYFSVFKDSIEVHVWLFCTFALLAGMATAWIAYSFAVTKLISKYVMPVDDST